MQTAGADMTPNDLIRHARTGYVEATRPAAGDKVRELVEKWRRYADGNFDDAANARSRCADELEAALGQGKANG